MKTAKSLGYKVIDEFNIDISSIVRLCLDNNTIKVIDEFGCNITNIVTISKESVK